MSYFRWLLIKICWGFSNNWLSREFTNRRVINNRCCNNWGLRHACNSYRTLQVRKHMMVLGTFLMSQVDNLENQTHVMLMTVHLLFVIIISELQNVDLKLGLQNWNSWIWCQATTQWFTRLANLWVLSSTENTNTHKVSIAITRFRRFAATWGPDAEEQQF